MVNLEDYDDDKKAEVNIHLLKYSNLLFVKEIAINGGKLEDFGPEMELEQRNEILDLLPVAVIDQIDDIILEEPAYDVMSKLSIPITCPKCRVERHLRIDLQDFFRVWEMSWEVY